MASIKWSKRFPNRPGQWLRAEPENPEVVLVIVDGCKPTEEEKRLYKGCMWCGPITMPSFEAINRSRAGSSGKSKPWGYGAYKRLLQRLEIDTSGMVGAKPPLDNNLRLGDVFRGIGTDGQQGWILWGEANDGFYMRYGYNGKLDKPVERVFSLDAVRAMRRVSQNPTGKVVGVYNAML